MGHLVGRHGGGDEENSPAMPGDKVRPKVGLRPGSVCGRRKNWCREMKKSFEAQICIEYQGKNEDFPTPSSRLRRDDGSRRNLYLLFSEKA